MASRNRLLILVASAISLSEMPRISRSRRSSSPNDASSEYGCCVGSGIESQIVICRSEALNAAPEVHRGPRVVVNHSEVSAREGAQKGGRGRPRRFGVHHEGLTDGVAKRPFPVGGHYSQLFGCRPVAARHEDEIVLPEPLVDE